MGALIFLAVFVAIAAVLAVGARKAVVSGLSTEVSRAEAAYKQKSYDVRQGLAKKCAKQKADAVYESEMAAWYEKHGRMEP